MYVGIDKAAAVRMYDLVREAWAEHLAELRAQHDALAELERPWLASRIELMETTDMAVVISQGQNEIKDLADRGLDIKPHRVRMIADAPNSHQRSPSSSASRAERRCARWPRSSTTTRDFAVEFKSTARWDLRGPSSRRRPPSPCSACPQGEVGNYVADRWPGEKT